MNGSTVSLINSTVSNNRGSSSLEVAGNDSYPTEVTTLNTVIANTIGGVDCISNVPGDVNAINAYTNSWFEDDSCTGTGNGDPRLGALTDNGGSTRTQAPLPNSGLIDAGDLTICTNAPVSGLDQRGEVRGVSTCFIGAAETIGDDGGFFVVPVPSGQSVIFGL